MRKAEPRHRVLRGWPHLRAFERTGRVSALIPRQPRRASKVTYPTERAPRQAVVLMIRIDWIKVIRLDSCAHGACARKAFPTLGPATRHRSSGRRSDAEAGVSNTARRRSARRTSYWDGRARGDHADRAMRGAVRDNAVGTYYEAVLVAVKPGRPGLDLGIAQDFRGSWPVSIASAAHREEAYRTGDGGHLSSTGLTPAARWR